MNPPPEDLTPPMRLALAYAPKRVRAAWELVLRFDVRFAGIVGATSEPLIGQMKLAWWRDAIGAEPSERPKGEPLLAALSELRDPALDGATAALVDAWEKLVVSDEWIMPVIDRFAKDRGSTVFGSFKQLTGVPEFPAAVAKQWATDDLRLHFGNRVPEGSVTNDRLPTHRAVRPLTIMAMSVRKISGPRLVWHALTGR